MCTGSTENPKMSAGGGSPEDHHKDQSGQLIRKVEEEGSGLLTLKDESGKRLMRT